MAQPAPLFDFLADLWEQAELMRIERRGDRFDCAVLDRLQQNIVGLSLVTQLDGELRTKADR